MDDPYPFNDSEDAHETVKRGRGVARDSMMLAATMTCEGHSREIQLRVRNISAGGMMADCPIDIEQGTKVRTALRNVGDVGGVVVWSRSGRVGVAFERQIDPLATRKPVGQGKGDTYVPPITGSRRPGMRNG